MPEAGIISYSDFAALMTALGTQISVTSVLAVLASAAGACVGLVFMWWGARKVTRMLMAAFRKGKLSI